MKKDYKIIIREIQGNSNTSKEYKEKLIKFYEWCKQTDQRTKELNDLLDKDYGKSGRSK